MNLHEKPFDETTLTKLKLFEDYAQSWIPTFVMQSYVNEIHIFDFFAGTGYDLDGVAGSSIRLIEKIVEQRENIEKNRVTVILHINEFEKSKFKLLVESCQNRVEQEKGIEHFLKLKFYNEDFEILFPRLMPLIEKHPSLVYLDQNGIKFLSNVYLKKLEQTKQTDFMYFTSSSYISRFGDSNEFKKHLSFLNLKELKSSSYKMVHRNLTEQLRRNISSDSKLQLFPFTLKKNKNIYGVIFGASHVRAVDKFLNLTWKYNGQNGDANFDIDDEATLGQMDIFDGLRLSKIDSFKQLVRERILDGSIKTNKEMLNFVHEHGHIGKHASDVIKMLKNEKLINFDAKSPCVTYDSVFKNNKIVYYEKI